MTSLSEGQTRTGSAVEAVANVLVGYGVALVSQLIIFAAYDVRLSLGQNAMIGVWFTLISLVRSYVLRRCFNRWRKIL